MKRRTFLQNFGSILAAMGIFEAGWLTLANRYYQALAEPSPRKLGLLIGINDYRQSPALNGCLTDVELQRELLIHRFGFQSSDIVTLTNEKASRKGIENAFSEHLVKQAKAGDIVVVHFSGYGSRVKQGKSLLKLENALVTTDSTGKKLDYLWEETLLLLLQSLATDKVTTVLDTSFSTPATVVPTGWRIRNTPSSVDAYLAAEEVELQQKLQNLLTAKSLLSPVSGMLLTATSDTNQVAREALLSGFSAGLFTYALTQYLWSATPSSTIRVSLSHGANSMYKLGSTQQPSFLGGKKTPKLITEAFLSDLTLGAQGVVKAVEEDGKNVNLWLGGIPPQVLQYYGVNSQFTFVTQENASSKLVFRSREGLKAKAQISPGTPKPQVGQLIQEKVRILPRNIDLTIGLDTKLERIERVDATSAFSNINDVSSVVAGEQSADYLFAKLPKTKIPDWGSSTSISISASRYGLFSLAGDLIPNSVGEIGEALKVTINRLSPKLKTLLAAKLWRLTENEGSSRLPVKVTMEIIQGISSRTLVQRETMPDRTAADVNKKSFPIDNGRLPTVPIGSRIAFRVQNMSDRPLYLMIVGLDSAINAYAFYPGDSKSESNSPDDESALQSIIINPGETQIIPSNTVGYRWVVTGSAFFAETQVILSTAPFKKTLAEQAAQNSGSGQEHIQTLTESVELVQALLQDLHNASNHKGDSSQTTESYSLDVNNWASFSFIYQVV
ncbi:MAG: caspase family protein [Nostocaceae cyanobacterium]|nr:caspase family protein [Nostocaceae cyanobacterium]